MIAGDALAVELLAGMSVELLSYKGDSSKSLFMHDATIMSVKPAAVPHQGFIHLLRCLLPTLTSAQHSAPQAIHCLLDVLSVTLR